MGEMGAAATARAVMPNGMTASAAYQKPRESTNFLTPTYQTRKAERQAQRAQQLAQAIAAERVRFIADNPISDSDVQAVFRRAEEQAVRSQRARDAQQAGMRRTRPKRRDNAPPAPNLRMYVRAMSVEIDSDTRLSPNAKSCCRLIYALEQKGEVIIKAGLAKLLGVHAKTVQGYLRQLREFGYIAPIELAVNAWGWIVGQIIRTTEKVLPFFLRARTAAEILADDTASRKAMKNGGNPEGVFPLPYNGQIQNLKGVEVIQAVLRLGRGPRTAPNGTVAITKST
jgi:hypothetical protein